MSTLLGYPITIVGAGIGGLAAATALAQRGASVEVLEQAPELGEVGAGLQVSPNGVRVLEALGLGAGLQAIGLRARGVCLRDHARGARVLRMDLPQDNTAAGYYFVHRADLLEMLATAAREAGVTIRTGARVTGAGLAPVPRLEVGGAAHASGALIIGADGLHSRLRGLLDGPGAPRFSGQVAWRAVVPNTPPQPALAEVHMGPGRHVVTYPLRGGEFLNIVAVQEREAWAEESWTAQDQPENLRRAFTDFSPALTSRFAQIETLHLWGLFLHPVARRWQDGSVALLGDAAHPTLPFLAQGANMALEDAWALAASLAHHDSPAAGLAAYEALRRPRAQKVIAAAAANARNYHLSLPPVRWAAHSALRVIGAVAPGMMLRKFDWLYGYDITAEA